MAINFEATFKSEQIDAFLKGLSKRHDQIENRDRQVVGIMSAIVFRDIIQHFDRSEGPDGKWKAWSKAYRRRMWEAGKLGNKILIDSGRLRNSFTMASYRTSNEGIVWYNNAKTKTGFPYAALHNEGGRFHPARPFMWLSDGAMETIEEQILRFLEGG